MPILVSLSELRDVVIVVYGIIGILFFFFAMIVLLVVGFSVKGLIGAVREMLDESVKPTLDAVKGTADSVRGTTDFMGKTAATPIFKTYGAIAGVKKGFSVLSGFKGRGKAS